VQFIANGIHVRHLDLSTTDLHIQERIMKAEGFATAREGSLVCSIPDADWYFTIRRNDGRTHPSFSDFHKKEVNETDIATRYLPNWESLHWVEFERDVLGKSESFAKDVEFKVIVHSTDKGSKRPKEVVEAFLDFMRNAIT
jgi:hypothetical protein